MKKYFFLFSFLFVFAGCAEDVQFNTPGFEGLKDTVFWRAIETTATIDAAGQLTITAYTGDEVLLLQTSGTAIGDYTLGLNDIDMVKYTLTNTDGSLVFSTGTDFGDGTITISEYDNVNGTVTGAFNFNAANIDANPLGGETLNFQKGVFYKIPITALLTVDL